MSGDEGGAPVGPAWISHMAAVLGYAQVRSWAMGALGGPAPEPEHLVRLTVRQLEAVDGLGTLPRAEIVAALIAGLRTATAPTICERTRPGHMLMTPWQPARMPLVLGDGTWFEAVTDAGARAVPLPLDAAPVFAAAVRMVDYLGPRVDAARRQRTDDTRPNRRR